MECVELAPAFLRAGWSESANKLLLLTRILNPKGIVPSSPGLRGTSYPGSASEKPHQPQRGCAAVRHTLIPRIPIVPLDLVLA